MDTSKANESRPPLPKNRLLTVGEVAKWLGINEVVLRRWIHRGLCRAMVLKPNGQYRMSWEDVRELIEDCAVAMAMPPWKRRSLLGQTPVSKQVGYWSKSTG